MKVWVGLYLMVWLIVLELLIAIDPIPPWWLIYVHITLGVLILLLAAVNFRAVRATSAPGRTKRTVRATLWLTVALAFFGALLYLNVGTNLPLLFGYNVWDIIHVFHVFLALAIVAQAASAATAYDMWEEKEFERGTAPGEIPEPEMTPGRPRSREPA